MKVISYTAILIHTVLSLPLKRGGGVSLLIYNALHLPLRLAPMEKGPVPFHIVQVPLPLPHVVILHNAKQRPKRLYLPSAVGAVPHLTQRIPVMRGEGVLVVVFTVLYKL